MRISYLVPATNQNRRVSGVQLGTKKEGLVKIKFDSLSRPWSKVDRKQRRPRRRRCLLLLL